MLSRRFFVVSSGVAATVFGSSIHGQTTKVSARGVDQSDYLFWLDEPSRQQARQTAETMAALLDSHGEQRVDAAKKLYATGSRELTARYRPDEFASRVAQTRAGVGAIRGRVLQGVEGGFRMLPNFPDGEYSIVVFDILVSRKNVNVMASEQFTLSRNLAAGAGWMLVDYYVGDKPFYRY